jgi:hypothetical protein
MLNGAARTRGCVRRWRNAAAIVVVVGAASTLLGGGASERIVFPRTDLEQHVERWKVRDGIAGFVISDYFCTFLVFDAELFLTVMSEHPDVFGEWSKALSDNSFVDRGGCVNRECLRTQMIDSLEAVNPRSTVAPLATQVLQQLKRTKVRVVE